MYIYNTKYESIKKLGKWNLILLLPMCSKAI